MKETSKITVALIELLNLGGISTQEELKAALQQQGFIVNQSKISRLLRKLGAVKIVNENGHIVYRMSQEPAPPTSKTSLAHLITEIVANEVLIVIRTSPGSASLIARLLDHHQKKLGIIGSVAGDDTIFIAPESTQVVTHCKEVIKSFLISRWR